MTEPTPEQETKPNENLLYIGQVSKMLNLSIDTLRQYDHSGRLKSLKRTPNNKRLYTLDSVYEYDRWRQKAEAMRKKKFENNPKRTPKYKLKEASNTIVIDDHTTIDKSTVPMELAALRRFARAEAMRLGVSYETLLRVYE